MAILDAGLSNWLRVWGPFGRCVEDLQLLLHVISGRDGVDPFTLNRRYTRRLQDVDLPSVRVGFLTFDGECSVHDGHC